MLGECFASEIMYSELIAGEGKCGRYQTKYHTHMRLGYAEPMSGYELSLEFLLTPSTFFSSWKLGILVLLWRMVNLGFHQGTYITHITKAEFLIAFKAARFAIMVGKGI